MKVFGLITLGLLDLMFVAHIWLDDKLIWLNRYEDRSNAIPYMALVTYIVSILVNGAAFVLDIVFYSEYSPKPVTVWLDLAIFIALLVCFIWMFKEVRRGYIHAKWNRAIIEAADKII